MRQYPQLQRVVYALYAATREAENDVPPTERREFLCRVNAPLLERLNAGEIINAAALRREDSPGDANARNLPALTRRPAPRLVLYRRLNNPIDAGPPRPAPHE